MSPEVALIRRVAFSSGHRYWRHDWSEDENRSAYGPYASPFNHGHNYVLDVSIAGAVDAATGMVVNIKWLDELLQNRVVGKLDGRSLNDEVSPFDRVAPCIENLLPWIVEQIGDLPDGIHLKSVRLEETPLFWGALERYPQPVKTLTRSYEFCASHRLHSENLTPEQNRELFGKCNNASGHGHNYVLEVTITGEPDAKTGMIVGLDALDRVVEASVLERYDHHNLNVDLPEFIGKVPTSEVIAQEIWNALDGKLPAKLHRIRLSETARSFFEIEAH